MCGFLLHMAQKERCRLVQAEHDPQRRKRGNWETRKRAGSLRKTMLSVFRASVFPWFRVSVRSDRQIFPNDVVHLPIYTALAAVGAEMVVGRQGAALEALAIQPQARIELSAT